LGLGKTCAHPFYLSHMFHPNLWLRLVGYQFPMTYNFQENNSTYNICKTSTKYREISMIGSHSWVDKVVYKHADVLPLADCLVCEGCAITVVVRAAVGRARKDQHGEKEEQNAHAGKGIYLKVYIQQWCHHHIFLHIKVTQISPRKACTRAVPFLCGAMCWWEEGVGLYSSSRKRSRYRM